MTGQTGLHGNFSRFQITYFTNHDDVRILSEDGPQSSSKGQVDFGVDLRLADAVEIVFNRVFNSQDGAASVVEFG